MRGPRFTVLACLALTPCVSHAAEIVLPPDVHTVGDGRRDIRTLYDSFAALEASGWTVDVVTDSAPESAGYVLPIVAIRSPQAGPATWILAGIHGEEPAGPNAIAASLDAIVAFGEHQPVVLLPLLNPHGYARNWRYLNMPRWDENAAAQSVGDSSHLLLDEAGGQQARSAAPSSPEAAAIGAYILATMKDYPPVVSIDLHEDNLLDRGYVYSQGVDGAADPLASAAIAVLRERDIPIQMSGMTRFDEPIRGGIIGPVIDSSIDELMSAATVFSAGRRIRGPAARTVLVFETPAQALPLSRRVDAHEALLRRLLAQISAAGE